MKCNTFILKCFLQFGWLSERRGNFFNLLQKEGVTQKGGGGSNPVRNYDENQDVTDQTK